MKKPSLLIIWLTVFIDLIGFGIVVPLVPVFTKRFDASSLTIGIVLACFSAMQFVFAPIWGRLSDRIGRRPIMLISTAGATISYAIFALGSGLQDTTTALVTLGIARAFAARSPGASLVLISRGDSRIAPIFLRSDFTYSRILSVLD